MEALGRVGQWAAPRGACAEWVREEVQSCRMVVAATTQLDLWWTRVVDDLGTCERMPLG